MLLNAPLKKVVEGEVLQQGVGAREDGSWEERAACFELSDRYSQKT